MKVDDFLQRYSEAAEETSSPPSSLWWLSFADPHRPKGSQFLGACIVEASSLPDAITASHLRGVNPGGEVKAVGPVEPEQLEGWPKDRLLTRAEIAAFDGRHA